MIKREDLNGKERDEIVKILEADIAEYTALAETKEAEDELLEMEKDIMLAMDDYMEYMGGGEYELPEDCVYDNQNYTKKTISDMIVKLIEKQEVSWEYVQGLYDLCKICMNKELVKISYGAYDSTLRLLNTLKYQGMGNWRNILAINAFVSACHLEYAMDTSYTIYLSKLHNALLDAMKKFNPETEMITEQAEQAQ